jgi:GntR family transcriptional regulator, carbon starvation induced regulator
MDNWRHEDPNAGDPQARVSRATLAAQVEEAIRADIISGALEPGQRLRASELTQRYGVSATPLREALQTLAARNLVALGPRLGATVAPVSRRELEDIYWLRELLEDQALERSIRLGDADWEQRVTAAYRAFESTHAGSETHDTDAATWSNLHRAFHDTLFDACDSAWLLRFVRTLSDHSERYRMLSRRRAQRHSLAEHEAIFHAAIERDVRGAQHALRRHLVATVDLLAQSLPATDRAEAAPVSADDADQPAPVPPAD